MGSGGRSSGSSKEYDRQLKEQRLATEKAEMEAENLRRDSMATQQRRKKRQQGSLLTPEEGRGDSSYRKFKSLLGGE